MLSSVMSLEDEITQLLHNKELKALVAALKPEAKAKFAEVLDIVKDREFWRTAQYLVELSTLLIFLEQERFIRKCYS